MTLADRLIVYRPLLVAWLESPHSDRECPPYFRNVLCDLLVALDRWIEENAQADAQRSESIGHA